MSDSKNFINLVPLGLTRGSKLNDVYILILREMLGMRCMAMIVSPEEFKMISAAMQGEKSELARVMRNTLDTFGIKLHCAVFHNNTTNNEYCAELLMQQGGDVRSVRQGIGAATVLAMELNVPLQVSRQYFDTMTGGAVHGNGTVEVRVPFTAMDKQLLEEAMREAVKNDNFEMAQALRDELRRREALSHTSTTTEF